jgi:hypothetical protein
MAETFHMKRNDRLPVIKATLRDVDGVVDLTTATEVRFHMAVEGETAKVDAAATILDATAGTVQYAWVAADTDTTGTYLAEFEVTWSDGRTETFPSGDYIVVKVRADLA